VLLGNRAQAHLRRHAFPAALADALRSTALDPVNPKGAGTRRRLDEALDCWT